MRAGYLAAPGTVAVGEFARPEPAEGEVLVRMTHGSICGSDLHVVFDGFHDAAALGGPGYPGHEGVGMVVESRSSRFAPGQAVLTVPPGSRGGCFSEYQSYAERFVVSLPDGDPARLLMAQQLGTTIFAMRRFWPSTRPAGTAAVIGAGSAGLFFVHLLRHAGFEQVVVAERNPGRRALAAALGAEVTESLPDAVRDLTGGAGADLVIEAAGYDSCRADAVAAVRDGGCVGLFGYPESWGPAPFPVYEAFRKSVRVEFVCGAQHEPELRSFREAVALVADGSLDVTPWLGITYPLDELPSAFDHAQSRSDAIKVNLSLG